MGLDIEGCRSELTYHAGYSGLHQIRAMAVAVANKTTWEEAWDFLMDQNHKNDELWMKSYYEWLRKHDLLEFRQLLHFSDAEGIMVKSWMLGKIDVRHSMTIGDLDRLYDELEEIRLALTSNPDTYQVHESRMRLFWMLYNLVKDEHENGIAIHFH